MTFGALAEAKRTALITGGTGGLGRAVTDTFLADGWRCVVPFAVAAEAQALERAVAGERRRGRLQLIEADLFDEEAVARAVAEADLDGAPLDAVVNLVGGFDAPGRVHETPLERFEAQLRLNLRAGYLVSAAALPGMLERAAGSIVCVSSRAALHPFAGAAGYVTAKAAVLAFVAALASEYAADGIRANAVVPGVIDTPANREAQPNADHSRWVSPVLIARVIAFLCSAEAAAISGARVPVYGRS